MPSVRRHVRLIIAGQKIEVETNALDLARAERDGEGDTVRGMRVLHEACLRGRVEGVPSKFETFLDQLDAIDDLDGDGEDSGELDPTRPAG